MRERGGCVCGMVEIETYRARGKGRKGDGEERLFNIFDGSVKLHTTEMTTRYSS